MPKTVTRDPEQHLVDLLLAFVNAPPPEDAAAVEAHFRRHPWTQRFPWATLAGDPPAQAVAAFTRDHEFAKKEVARIVRTGRRADAALRETMAARLHESLTIAAGPLRLPRGELGIHYRRGELVLGFTPFLNGVAACITYGLALLLDTSRDYVRALLQCGACGKFFRRTRSHQSYCSRACIRQGTRERNRERQWRHRHPEEAGDKET